MPPEPGQPGSPAARQPEMVRIDGAIQVVMPRRTA